MATATHALYLSLTELDKDILGHVYYRRCLTLAQLHRMTQQTSTRTQFLKEVLAPLIRQDVLEVVMYAKGEFGLQLTNQGVQLVRTSLQLQTTRYNQEKRRVEPGYLTASELRVAPRFMAHQIKLNDLIYDIEHLVMTHYKGHVIHCIDEKHLAHYQHIRPDALIQVGGIDFFIEMDLGTEGAKRLSQKWQHYRKFLLKEQTHYHERTIKVMFCLAGLTPEKLEARRILVYQLAMAELGDCFDTHFDLVVGDAQEMKSFIQDTLNPYAAQPLLKTLQMQPFRLFDPSQFNEYCSKGQYSYYLTSDVQTNKPESWLLIDATQFSAKHLTTCLFHSSNQSILKHRYQLSPKLVVHGTRDVHQLMKTLIPDDLSQIYRSTDEGLATRQGIKCFKSFWDDS